MRDRSEDLDQPGACRPIPLFVIGDVEKHGVGSVVNFWGSQWRKNNTMSASGPPAAFKGYASSVDLAAAGCGGTWTAGPGKSDHPPSTLPDLIAVIVTSMVEKQGSQISGNIKQIVMVRPNDGYAGDPGHAGTGPVTSIVCTAP